MKTHYLNYINPIAYIKLFFHWLSFKSVREQRLIHIALIVLIFGSMYQFGIYPVWRDMQRFKTTLPELQTQLLHVQALSAQVQTMPPLTQIDDNYSQSSLKASLDTATITATVSEQAPWVITVNNANGDALWAWLRQYSPQSMTLKRKKEAPLTGLWSGEIVLK